MVHCKSRINYYLCSWVRGDSSGSPLFISNSYLLFYFPEYYIHLILSFVPTTAACHLVVRAIAKTRTIPTCTSLFISIIPYNLYGLAFIHEPLADRTGVTFFISGFHGPRNQPPRHGLSALDDRLRQAVAVVEHNLFHSITVFAILRASISSSTCSSRRLT